MLYLAYFYGVIKLDRAIHKHTRMIKAIACMYTIFYKCYDKHLLERRKKKKKTLRNNSDDMTEKNKKILRFIKLLHPTKKYYVAKSKFFHNNPTHFNL